MYISITLKKKKNIVNFIAKDYSSQEIGSWLFDQKQLIKSLHKRSISENDIDLYKSFKADLITVISRALCRFKGLTWYFTENELNWVYISYIGYSFWEVLIINRKLYIEEYSMKLKSDYVYVPNPIFLNNNNLQYNLSDHFDVYAKTKTPCTVLF